MDAVGWSPFLAAFRITTCGQYHRVAGMSRGNKLKMGVSHRIGENSRETDDRALKNHDCFAYHAGVSSVQTARSSRYA